MSTLWLQSKDPKNASKGRTVEPLRIHKSDLCCGISTHHLLPSCPRREQHRPGCLTPGPPLSIVADGQFAYPVRERKRNRLPGGGPVLQDRASGSARVTDTKLGSGKGTLLPLLPSSRLPSLSSPLSSFHCLRPLPLATEREGWREGSRIFCVLLPSPWLKENSTLPSLPD